MSEIVSCAERAPDDGGVRGARSAHSWWVPRLPGGVPEARHRVQEAMRAWGEPAERIEAAALIVTELVTNAVRHTSTRRIRCRVLRSRGVCASACGTGAGPGFPPRPHRPTRRVSRSARRPRRPTSKATRSTTSPRTAGASFWSTRWRPAGAPAPHWPAASSGPISRAVPTYRAPALRRERCGTPGDPSRSGSSRSAPSPRTTVRSGIAREPGLDRAGGPPAPGRAPPVRAFAPPACPESPCAPWWTARRGYRQSRRAVCRTGRKLGDRRLAGGLVRDRVERVAVHLVRGHVAERHRAVGEQRVDTGDQLAVGDRLAARGLPAVALPARQPLGHRVHGVLRVHPHLDAHGRIDGLQQLRQGGELGDIVRRGAEGAGFPTHRGSLRVRHDPRPGRGPRISLRRPVTRGDDALVHPSIMPAPHDRSDRPARAVTAPSGGLSTARRPGHGRIEST